MQFTDKYIKNLQSKPVRYEVREGNGQGFGIRISPLGQKTWIFLYHFENRKRRLTLGNYPEISLAEARKKHQEALRLLATDKDPGATKQQALIETKQAPTVADLVQEYLEKWAKPRKRSWKEDERIFNKDILPNWGKIKAKNITRRDMVLLLDSILERGSPVVANRTLAVVRRLFNFAVERDILTTSPCLAIKAPSKESPRDRMLTEDEISNFWHGLAQASMTEELKLLLKLMLTTAQREGELVNAEWTDIDFKQQCWTIPAERAKNGNAHRVPLSTLAIHLLQQIRQLNSESKWLFPSPRRDQPITSACVSRAIARNQTVFEATKSFTPHDLRRTAASHMTALGASRLTVSKILNHVDSGVTAIYDRHTYDQEKREALEKWGNYLKKLHQEENTTK